MTEGTEPRPAALYARVSSDRQDVDLSVAGQLRALRDYAEKNGYVVVREYVDEAESGRDADRPRVQQDGRRGQEPQGRIPRDSSLEILALFQGSASTPSPTRLCSGEEASGWSP